MKNNKTDYSYFDEEKLMRDFENLRTDKPIEEFINKNKKKRFFFLHKSNINMVCGKNNNF